jgi:hypothetical protein
MPTGVEGKATEELLAAGGVAFFTVRGRRREQT